MVFLSLVAEKGVPRHRQFAAYFMILYAFHPRCARGLSGNLEAAQLFRPEVTHARTSRIVEWSKKLSQECAHTLIPPV